MPVKYEKSPEVEKIGRNLISQHHRSLLSVRVEFLFSDVVPKRAGKEIWGLARRISSLSAFLAGEDGEDGVGAFFVIVISKPIWEQLSDSRKIALVDHELMHCFVDEKDDGTPSLQLLPHDVEAFAQEVLRHGLWRNDLEQFGQVAIEAAQRSLYEEQDEGKPALRIAS